MRIMWIICGILLFAGCTPSGSMIELYETEYPHLISGTIHQDQVKESIMEGAKKAGWTVETQGNSTILATYQIRIHTVQVSIYYSDTYYRTNYKSSIGMKMYCTVRKREKSQVIVSGAKNCPANRAPISINANYKTWVDSLVVSIENSLATN